MSIITQKRSAHYCCVTAGQVKWHFDPQQEMIKPSTCIHRLYAIVFPVVCLPKGEFLIFTTRKRSLEQGNVFPGVSLLGACGRAPQATHRADTSPGKHPPSLRADTLARRHPPQRHGHSSRRYASYWNAFFYILRP